MEWLTSWPSVLIGCGGLTACVIGLLLETFMPDKPDKPEHLCTALRRQRAQEAKEKAAHRGGTCDGGNDKHVL